MTSTWNVSGSCGGGEAGACAANAQLANDQRHTARGQPQRPSTLSHLQSVPWPLSLPCSNIIFATILGRIMQEE